ncbi:hypothetical protein BDZ91DRAFT_752865, partial [Kalaharituber pfeilii]
MPIPRMREQLIFKFFFFLFLFILHYYARSRLPWKGQFSRYSTCARTQFSIILCSFQNGLCQKEM